LFIIARFFSKVKHIFPTEPKNLPAAFPSG
jgi:hypothetical protein